MRFCLQTELLARNPAQKGDRAVASPPVCAWFLRNSSVCRQNLILFASIFLVSNLVNYNIVIGVGWRVRVVARRKPWKIMFAPWQSIHDFRLVARARETRAARQFPCVFLPGRESNCPWLPPGYNADSPTHVADSVTS